MFGQQLHTNKNGENYFRFYRNRRTPFRSSIDKGTIIVKGDLEDWFKCAYCYSCPCLVRDMNGAEPYSPIDHKEVKPDILVDVG